MIKAKTVFVLGAGASIPYGFPSGAALRTEIVGAVSSSHWLIACLSSTGGISVADVTTFAEAFQRSDIASIDSFLGKRTEFAQIGKLAIAACLCQKEDPNALARTGNDDHWYGHLWNTMHHGTSSVPELQVENHVRFITFNYDRSLEAHLFQAVKNSYPNCSPDQALSYVNSLNILHVYGQLAKFHHSPQAGYRDYNVHGQSSQITAAAGGIRIMPEHREDDEIFKTARRMFDWAEAICFLGFGFDPLNVERLGLESVLAWKKDRKQQLPVIVASTYGKTETEKSKIVSVLCPTRGWSAYNLKNTDTLRESGVI